MNWTISHARIGLEWQAPSIACVLHTVCKKSTALKVCHGQNGCSVAFQLALRFLVHVSIRRDRHWTTFSTFVQGFFFGDFNQTVHLWFNHSYYCYGLWILSRKGRLKRGADVTTVFFCFSSKNIIVLIVIIFQIIYCINLLHAFFAHSVKTCFDHFCWESIHNKSHFVHFNITSSFLRSVDCLCNIQL